MEQIQVIGIKDLDEVEIEAVNRITNKYYSKIQRDTKSLAPITVYIKPYTKEGKQRKFAIHIKVMVPTNIIVSTKVIDWNLEKALHRSFEDIEKRIQHTLHTDNQHKKSYS